MPALTVHQALDLARQHQDAGRFQDAATLCRQILAVHPGSADAWHALGIALARQGKLDAAVESYQRTLALQPHRADTHYNLGLAFGRQGEFEKAVECFRRALGIDLAFVEAEIHLGIALGTLERFDEAVAALQRALTLRPDCADAANNLAVILAGLGKLDDALAASRLALELKPIFPEAYNNLGRIHFDRGEHREAMSAHRRAVELAPGQSVLHSALLLLLHYLPDLPAETIADEHRQWNASIVSARRAVFRSHPNSSDPERRLRIGYVSPDLFDHVAGRSLLPLFRNHDARQFEIFCYSGARRPDSMTDSFRGFSHQWRSTLGVPDETLARMIHQDGVDILVDLSQHMLGNRLPMFAFRPAPVQVSFAGYPESAGLAEIEYRISDRWLERNAECGMRSAELDAEAAGAAGFRIPNSEFRIPEQIYLLDSFWCYDPCGVEVGVNALPATTHRHITFGSLNHFGKINEPALKLWARVLMRVPDSRLILLSGLGGHRQRTIEFLAQHGIEPGRVDFVAPGPRREYLERYHRLDVALDPFPYGGHTTSLDALWMGVPVVSLAGARPVSRAGLSILSNVGLPELVGSSEDAYVDIAANFADDLPRLAELRRTLRSRLENSVLMDGPRFARQIEAAYRAMWRGWCAKRNAAGPQIKGDAAG